MLEQRQPPRRVVEAAQGASRVPSGHPVIWRLPLACLLRASEGAVCLLVGTYEGSVSSIAHPRGAQGGSRLDSMGSFRELVRHLPNLRVLDVEDTAGRTVEPPLLPPSPLPGPNISPPVRTPPPAILCPFHAPEAPRPDLPGPPDLPVDPQSGSSPRTKWAICAGWGNSLPSRGSRG